MKKVLLTAVSLMVGSGVLFGQVVDWRRFFHERVSLDNKISNDANDKVPALEKFLATADAKSMDKDIASIVTAFEDGEEIRTQVAIAWPCSRAGAGG